MRQDKHIRFLPVAVLAAALVAALAVFPAAQSAFAATPAQTGTPPPQQRDPNGTRGSRPVTEIVIRNVAAGSPAEKAGLQQGDAIVSINGTAVAGLGDLSTAVKASKPGDSLALEVKDTNGATRSISVTLAAAPDKPDSAFRGVGFGARDSGGARNAPGQSPVPDAAPRFVIASVVAGSPAELAGLKQGDAIVAVDGNAVAAQDDLAGLVTARKPGDSIKLEVTDAAGASRTISVTLGDNPSKVGTAYLGIRYSSLRVQQSQPDQQNLPALPGQGRRSRPFGQPTPPAQPGQPGQGYGRSGMGAGPITVVDVQGGSPADQAGLRAGDQITAVNDAPVTGLRMLMQTLASSKVGDALTLKVARGSETVEVTVTLGENPNQTGKAFIGISVSPAPLRIPLDGSNGLPNFGGSNP